MAMAAFLDFAVGTLLAVVVGNLMGKQVNLWYSFVGGFLALSPDLVEMAKARLKWEKLTNNHHESWDHCPIPMITIGTILGCVIGGWYWGIVTFLCLFFHYNHDMEIGNSGGIAFFAPFSRKFFAWWRGFYDPKTSAMYRPENEFDSWIRRNWLRPSTMSMREMLIGAISISTATGLTMGFKIGALLFCLCWIGTWMIWLSAEPKK